MGPIACRLFLIVSLLGGYSASVRADDISSNSLAPTQTARLPAFVPSSGHREYKIAVSENSASAKAARQAAESLSAKFTDMTTGSIPKTVPAPKPAPLTPAPQKVAVAPEAHEGRAIELTATHVDDPKNQRVQISQSKTAEATRTAHKLPRMAIPKVRTADDHQQLNASLTAIGQKVSFLDLLTNPALWKK